MPPPKTLSGFGKILRKAKENQGITSQELADRIKVDKSYISKVEKGERQLNKIQVIQLAELLQQNEHDWLTIWYAEKILNTLRNEDVKASYRGLKRALIVYYNENRNEIRTGYAY